MSRSRYLEEIAVITTVNSSFFYRSTADPKKVLARTRELHREARLLKEQIERHCDFSGSVTIEEVYEDTCEFCGANWTEDDSSYNGGCCEQDLDFLEG